MPVAKTKSPEAKTIILPQLQLADVVVTVVGDTPLIVHAWSEKAKRQMLDKQLKAPKQGREAKDPEQDFQDSLYKMDGGGYGFPSVAFKTAAVDACTSISGVTKVEARQAFHIVGESTKTKMTWNGGAMRQDLVRILGDDPEMREDMVSLNGTVADIRYRAQFVQWWCHLDIRYNSRTLSHPQILNLLEIAGFGVGIGEWRPQKNGQYGLFHVATAEELDWIGKADKKAKADAKRLGRKRTPKIILDTQGKSPTRLPKTKAAKKKRLAAITETTVGEAATDAKSTVSA